jgi:hypothetical protein
MHWGSTGFFVFEAAAPWLSWNVSEEYISVPFTKDLVKHARKGSSVAHIIYKESQLRHLAALMGTIAPGRWVWPRFSLPFS